MYFCPTIVPSTHSAITPASHVAVMKMPLAGLPVADAEADAVAIAVRVHGLEAEKRHVLDDPQLPSATVTNDASSWLVESHTGFSQNENGTLQREVALERDLGRLRGVEELFLLAPVKLAFACRLSAVFRSGASCVQLETVAKQDVRRTHVLRSAGQRLTATDTVTTRRKFNRERRRSSHERRSAGFLQTGRKTRVVRAPDNRQQNHIGFLA